MADRHLKQNIDCPSCRQQIPAGVRFCLNCGAFVNGADKSSKRLCRRCNLADEFNVAFCVGCGGKLEGQAAPRKRKTGFSWQVDEQSASLAPPKMPVPVRQPARSSLGPISFVLSGALSGALIALAITQTGLWHFAVERCHWPRQGLVVYVQAPLAQVALEQEKTSQVIIAQVHKDGSLKLKHLPAGRYRMFIGAPGCLSAFSFVDVEANRPTVIGFPNPIQLPPS